MANAPKPPTRRAFLNLCLIGGGAAAASAGLLSCSAPKERRGQLRPNDVLYRNPAFVRRRTPEGSVLSTQSRDGRQIAYRMDPAAEFLWESLPAPREQAASPEVTVAQLLDAAAAKYGGRDPEQVRTEALAFLQEATQAGIVVVPPRWKARIAYEPRRPD